MDQKWKAIRILANRKCMLAIEAIVSDCIKKKLQTVINLLELFYFL